MLGSVPGVEMLASVGYPARHAWHLLVVRLPHRERDAVMQRLLESNIGVGLHFKALHLHRFYRDRLGVRPESLPHATRASESILSLPLFPAMTCDDVRDVAEGRLGEVRDSHPDGVVTGSPNPLVVGGVVQIWWDFAHSVPVLPRRYLTG